MTERVDTVVVGAGPAGLALSAELHAAGHEHVVLERGRAGETWHTQRWDGFHLNTPGWMNGLGGEREAFAPRDEVVRALAQHAATLPVREGVEVHAARPAAGGWWIETSSGPLYAQRVVAASGAQSVPVLPAAAARVPAGVRQQHAADYRRPDELPAGAVLVVGGAQTGLQIAEELAEAGRRVHLATSRVGRMPRRHRGRDTSEWLCEMGLYARHADAVAPAVRRARQPQVSGTRGGHTVSLQGLARLGVVLHGGLLGVEGGRAHFGPDLAVNVAFADAEAARLRREIDEHIARRGAAAPPAAPDPVEAPLERLDDLRDLALGREVRSVVWATGFRGAFDWLPSVALDPRGLPRHRDGIGWLPGLFAMGLPWMIRRSSGIFFGMRRDARDVAAALAVEPALRLAA